MINDIVPPLQSCPEHGHGSERKGGRIHSSKSPEMGVEEVSAGNCVWRVFLVGAGDQPGAQLINNERERLVQVVETRELQERKKRQRVQKHTFRVCESAQLLSLSLLD